MLIMARRRIQRAPRWLVVGVMSAAIVLMPFGVGGSAEQLSPAPTTERTAKSSSVYDGLPGVQPIDLDTNAVAVANPDGFMMLSAPLSDDAALALALDRDSRVAKRARRAVKKAVFAGLDAGPAGDPDAMRATRKAISTAKARLDRTVARGMVSRETTDALIRDLHKLIKTGQTGAQEVELDEAIAAGVISPKNAAALLKGLEKAAAEGR